MSDTIKISSLVWGFSGGVAKYVATLSRLNNRADIKVQTIIIGSPDEVPYKEDFKAHAVDTVSRGGRFDLSWTNPCRERIERFSPDLLFIHGGCVDNAMLWLVKRTFKRTIAYVNSNHGYATRPFKLMLPLRERLSPLNPCVYQHGPLAVVTVAHACKQQLVKNGVDPEKITVVHNGIDPELPTANPISRSELGIEPGEVIVGVLSRLVFVKGVAYLIDAFEMVLGRCRNLHLAIVGDGTHKARLQRQVRRSGIESRVHFVGSQSNAESWLDLFDIYALPSLAEAHSIGLLEAMRSEKPIVATDVGGNTESVRNEQEALIVPPANSGRLAEALIRLVEDRALAARLARSARRRFLEHFTVDRMLSETGEWLHQCVKRARCDDLR